MLISFSSNSVCWRKTSIFETQPVFVILLCVYVLDPDPVVRLLWSLNESRSRSRAVGSAPKWQWNMNVSFLFFLSLCSFLLKLQILNRIFFFLYLLFSVVFCFLHSAFSLFHSCQWLSELISSLRPLMFSLEQLCVSQVVVSWVVFVFFFLNKHFFSYLHFSWFKPHFP